MHLFWSSRLSSDFPRAYLTIHNLEGNVEDRKRRKEDTSHGCIRQMTRCVYDAALLFEFIVRDTDSGAFDLDLLRSFVFFCWVST